MKKNLKEMNRMELSKKLINMGIIYAIQDGDEYEVSIHLEGLYNWGFTTVTTSLVMDPVMDFYDWNCQSIVSIDLDGDTRHRIMNGVLVVKERRPFSDVWDAFSVNLNQGSHTLVENFVEAGEYQNGWYVLTTDGFFIKNDGDVLIVKDEDDFAPIENAKPIAESMAQSYINAINNYISRNEYRKEVD